MPSALVIVSKEKKKRASECFLCDIRPGPCQGGQTGFSQLVSGEMIYYDLFLTLGDHRQSVQSVSTGRRVGLAGLDADILLPL